MSSFATKSFVVTSRFWNQGGAPKESLARYKTISESDSPTVLDTIVFLNLSLLLKEEDAARQALEAVRKQGQEIRSLKAASDFALVFGSPGDQIDALKAVAAAEPRLAVETLRRVVRIQADSQRMDEALKTVDELISRSPADSSLYSLYADVASRAGRADLAVNRLIEALRYVEEPTSIRLQLATVLQSQARLQDAIAMLQTAFESEKRDGRKMEIFRRQAELAMQAGTIENLIASLREKQAKEQGGAKYGVYLAEIFILQNDFQMAKEELTKSLGRSPDNSAAVSRLLELADQAGDQEESLRLSALLAELTGTSENRANYLAKLLAAGQAEVAVTELDAAREDILKDPAPWMPVLVALNRAGLRDKARELVQEIANARSDDAAIRYAVAMMYLVDDRVPAAEQELWGIVESGDLKASLSAVAASTVSSRYFSTSSPSMARMFSLQLLGNEVANALAQNMSTYTHYYSGGFARYWQGASASGQPTNSQKAQVRALFLLFKLAQATNSEEAFNKRLDDLLARKEVPRDLRIALLMQSQDLSRVGNLVREQAADVDGDPAVDRFILDVIQAEQPGMAEPLKALGDRMAAKDEEFAYQRLIGNVAKEASKIPNLKGAEEAAKKKEVAEALEKSIDHPGRKHTAAELANLAGLAVSVGNLDLACTWLRQSVEKSETELNGQQSASKKVEILAPQAAVVSKLILGGSKEADSFFEQFCTSVSGAAAGFPALRSGSYVIYGTPSHVLAQTSDELVAGDTQFPIGAFKMLFPEIGKAAKSGDLRKWFSTRSKEERLDAFLLGLVYLDWLEGDKEKAIARLEKVYQANPSPRTAALLFEAYEKSQQAGKALEVIELAEMQPTETADVRALRRLRLLRAAGKTAEAKEAGEKLARGRVSTSLKSSLANELNLLGISTEGNPTFANIQGFRSQRDPGDRLRLQINKLQAAQKYDEIERIAMQILNRPLPQQNDYRQSNLRQVVIGALQSAKRTDKITEALLERLASDPNDFDAAVRLAELERNDASNAATERLAELIERDPERAASVSYAIMLLQQRPEGRDRFLEALAKVMKRHPESLRSFGMGFAQIIQMAAGSESGKALAETLAAMSDADYDAFFLRDRLSGQQQEASSLSILADIMAKAGNTDAAIILLQRAMRGGGQNPYEGFGPALALAELQLAKGRKEEAAATMRDFISKKPDQRYYGFMAPQQSGINLVLTNILANWRPGVSQFDEIRRLGSLAEKTGNFGALMDSLRSPSEGKSVIDNALLIQTLLNRPEAAKLWREAALGDGGMSPGGGLPVLAIGMKQLAGEADAEKLLVALIKKYGAPDTFNSVQMISYLAQVLPILGEYAENPVVKKHLASAASKILSDQGASQYLIHQEGFLDCVNLLLDYNMEAEARALFEATASARAARNYGRQPAWDAITTRLSGTEVSGKQVEMLLAAKPDGTQRLTVRWTSVVKIKSARVEESNAGPAWSEATLGLSEKDRPVRLEILAGANPALMEKVAQVDKPPAAGTTAIKTSAPLGLLQAKWSWADGSAQYGPLLGYVAGENLISNDGVPKDEGGDVSKEGFNIGLPGPLGKKSAASFGTTSPKTEFSVTLARFVPGTQEGTLVLSGWLKAAGGHGGFPMFSITKVESGGKRNQDGIYLESAMAGQWRQAFRVWEVGEGSSSRGLGKNVEALEVALRFNPTGGYNYQYQFQGEWAGLQLVMVPREASGVSGVEKLLDEARAAAGKKEYGPAADALTAAFKADPERAMRAGERLWMDVFKNAGRMDQLFTLFSNPALYLSNPLRSNQVTMQSQQVVVQLAAVAMASDAPKAAKEWLRSIQSYPLTENLRFVVDSALFLQTVERTPETIKVDETLDLLGLTMPTVNITRLRRLWQGDQVASTVFPILAAIDKMGKGAEMLAALRSRQIPVEHFAITRFLEAWFAAPSSPAEALALWKESIALRANSERQIRFHADSDRALALRIGGTGLSSEELIPAIQDWLGHMDAISYGGQNISAADILYQVAIGKESEDQEKYLKQWESAEFEALKKQGYQPSRARVRELADRLFAAQDWKQLEELFALAQAVPTLKNSPIHREFEQLRSRMKFAKGELESAWPVTWCEPGTNSRKVKVRWQWNLKDIEPREGKFDVAIAVAEQPILPEIPGQQKMEVWFGEMPGSMKPVASLDGAKADGEVEIELPAANGFLRAVSLVNGRQMAGPMTPVISGTRIFPPAGQALKEFLTFGTEPIASNILVDSGTAPDGSPAVTIGSAAASKRLIYKGNEVPVQPGKFYVVRGWIRRAGTGSVSSSVIFKSPPGSTRNDLNMILSEREESVGNWVLYTRAIPSLPQHTFWIPFKEVSVVVPQLWDVEPGTQVAGWEMLEIDGWKYGEWISELAMLRENAGSPIASKDIDRVLDLAAIEPLTSLDYHGDWLADQLILAGQAGKLPALYRAALAAEANPLFSRPKLWRLFGNLLNLYDKPGCPDEVKLEAAQLALENPALLKTAQTLGFQRRSLFLMKGREGEPEFRRKLIADISGKLNDPANAGTFLADAINARAYKDDRPLNEFLTLVLALNDEQLTQLILKELAGKKVDSLDASKRNLAQLVLESAQAGKIDDKWSEKLKRAITLSEKSTAPDDFVFWPLLLADWAAAQNAAPEIVLQSNQAAYDRVMRQNRKEAVDMREVSRAGWPLIEVALSQNRKDVALEVARQSGQRLQSFEGTLGEDVLRLVLKSVNLLNSAEMGEARDGLVKAVETSVRKSPKMTEAYSKYLGEPVPTS